MTVRNKIYVTVFVVAEFIAVMFFLGVAAHGADPSDTPAQEELTTIPEHEMSLVSFSPWVVEGEVVGTLAVYVYDDIRTERAADYWELYDTEGNLLAVSWFDEFGIERTAVDRGIVEEQEQLEGVFVLLVNGESV